MARGGGVVAGTKHSAENEKHHSSGGGGGSASPLTMAIFFVIVGLIFLVLAIAVPIALVADPPGDSCSPAESVNRKEQAICVPDNLNYNWIADVDADGKKYGKVYKANNDTVEFIQSSFTWLNYETKLKGSYDYFAFSVPYYISGRFAVYCDGKKCDHLRLYLLSKKEFEASIDSNDEFHEKTFHYDFKKFDDEQWNYFQYYAYGPDYYYLLFSLNKDKKVKIKYSIEMINTVVDTSKLTAAQLDGTRAKFEKMKKGEFIVVEYPTTENYTECVDNPKYPESFEVKLHNDRVSLGGAVAAGAILGLIAIACFIVGVVFFLKK